MKVKTPVTENIYPVLIGSFSFLKNSIVDMNTVDIPINSTLGELNYFKAHPTKRPT